MHIWEAVEKNKANRFCFSMQITHTFISAFPAANEKLLCSLSVGAVGEINAIWLKIKLTFSQLTAEKTGH